MPSAVANIRLSWVIIKLPLSFDTRKESITFWVKQQSSSFCFFFFRFSFMNLFYDWMYKNNWIIQVNVYLSADKMEIMSQ